VKRLQKYKWEILFIVIFFTLAFIIYDHKDQQIQSLTAEKVVADSYSSLYESRRYFDEEITRLHNASKDMIFLWHPDLKKQYLSSIKKTDSGEEVEENIIDIDKYKLIITSPIYSKEGYKVDASDYYTHIMVTENGKYISEGNYKGGNFDHTYKIQVGETFYYLIGICQGGMRGCGILIPIVNTNNKLRDGKVIADVDFSNYLRIKDFFTINSELYLVLDDSRYFWESVPGSDLSVSNNARRNSAIPRIFKFDKKTGNPVLAIREFNYIYKSATEKMGKDLYSLRDSIPGNIRQSVMNTLTGKSLIPYFDYYLGMAIINNPSKASEIRKTVEELYLDLYGTEHQLGVHLDGYKDFEEI